MLKSKYFMIVSALFLTVACQTAPKRYAEESQGQWKTKVLVRDKVKSSSHIVYIDINAIKNERLRLDATLPSGYHLASLVLEKGRIEYALMQEKAFYKGKPTNKALRPILNIPLSPQILYNIVFDYPVQETGWTCQSGESGAIKFCENLTSETKITWDDKNPKSKFVKIEHPQGSLQMRFLEFDKSLRSSKKLFSLVPPKGFKVYSLN